MFDTIEKVGNLLGFNKDALQTALTCDYSQCFFYDGDDDSYPTAFIFDGDMGLMSISPSSEMDAENGYQISLIECSYICIQKDVLREAIIDLDDRFEMFK